MRCRLSSRSALACSRKRCARMRARATSGYNSARSPRPILRSRSGAVRSSIRSRGPTRMWCCAPAMHRSSRLPNARIRFFDLALGHRVVGSPADVGHVVTLQPFRQVVRDIRGAVVGQQPWPMEDPGFVEPRGIQRHFERGVTPCNPRLRPSRRCSATCKKRRREPVALILCRPAPLLGAWSVFFSHEFHSL